MHFAHLFQSCQKTIFQCFSAVEIEIITIFFQLCKKLIENFISNPFICFGDQTLINGSAQLEQDFHLLIVSALKRNGYPANKSTDIIIATQCIHVGNNSQGCDAVFIHLLSTFIAKMLHVVFCILFHGFKIERGFEFDFRILRFGFFLNSGFDLVLTIFKQIYKRIMRIFFYVVTAVIDPFIRAIITTELNFCTYLKAFYNFIWCFTKSLYVTDVSQRLHFGQLFKIMELLGRPYSKGLEHIYYGRVRLPEGKIASRLGKQALCRDILNYSLEKTRQIVAENANLSDKEKENVIKAVGTGAAIFSVIKNERIKDMVFDLDKAIDFEGDTAPYIQYTRARCCSIESKAGASGTDFAFDYSQIASDASFALIKELNRFEDVTLSALKNHEPSLICRQLVEISKAFNKFYASSRVIDEGKVQATRLSLVTCTKNILTAGLKLLGIQSVDKM